MLFLCIIRGPKSAQNVFVFASAKLKTSADYIRPVGRMLFMFALEFKPRAMMWDPEMAPQNKNKLFRIILP